MCLLRSSDRRWMFCLDKQCDVKGVNTWIGVSKRAGGCDNVCVVPTPLWDSDKRGLFGETGKPLHNQLWFLLGAWITKCSSNQFCLWSHYFTKCNPTSSNEKNMNHHFTVYDGDVSALVVFRQCQGLSLCRGHNADCAAAVGALQVRPRARAGRRDSQTLWEGEGLPGAVAAVGLVPPLHHRGLDGRGVVLAVEDHRLEEHRISLLLPHRDFHAITHICWRTQNTQRMWEYYWEGINM